MMNSCKILIAQQVEVYTGNEQRRSVCNWQAFLQPLHLYSSQELDVTLSRPNLREAATNAYKIDAITKQYHAKSIFH